MIRTRAQLHLLHRRAQQILACLIDHAVLPHLRRSHITIALQGRSHETRALSLARAFDPRADRLRLFTQPIARQFLVIDARHLDVNIDAVEQWTTDAFLIAQHIRQRASAFLGWVAVIPAGTKILTMFDSRCAVAWRDGKYYMRRSGPHQAYPNKQYLRQNLGGERALVVELMLPHLNSGTLKPMDIIALLQCLQPTLTATTVRQFSRIIFALFAMNRRADTYCRIAQRNV